MKLHPSAFIYFVAIALLSAGLAVSRADDIVTFESESGALGSDWVVSNGTPAYITIITDDSGYIPSNSMRVATYSVTFPEAGTYQLYARVLVGPGGYNDDSLFYGNGFGTKNPTSSSDWVLVNGLAGVGYTASSDVVNGGGTAGNLVWKWINLSEFAGNVSFTVNGGNLTQTLQIGARENGLDIDKFAFGTVGTPFTVSNLDTGTLPAPTNPNTNMFFGPDGIAIHRFSSVSNGLNLDGANPGAGLIFLDNVLVGTALNGGVQGNGTVFYVSLDGTNFDNVHSFATQPDAGNPQGDLETSGNLFWGTTRGGGNNGVGAVFVGNTLGGISVVRSFANVSADEATNFGGASPGALLALSGNTLYGTTTAGGEAGNGTVFSLSTNGSNFSVLHDFSALDSSTGTNIDGALPLGGLILSGDTLYGTTYAGGSGDAGIVFSIATSGSNFTDLHNFTALDSLTGTNSDGAFPSGGLVLSNGMLYGTTLSGGTGGKGVVFSIGADGTGFKVLHDFSATDPATGTNADGASPCAPLALSNGNLYGTASGGGAGANGTVFSMSINGSNFLIIHAFTATESDTGTNRDGARPVAGVLPLENALYGTAFSGGPGGEGTVFGVPIPYPRAVITNIVHNGNGSVTLYFLGGPNSTNIIQAANALTPPAAWKDLSTNAADPAGEWQFTETNATNPMRFYRSYAPQN